MRVARKRGESVKEVGSRIIRENGGGGDLRARSSVTSQRPSEEEEGEDRRENFLLLARKNTKSCDLTERINRSWKRFKYSKPFYLILIIFFFNKV